MDQWWYLSPSRRRSALSSLPYCAASRLACADREVAPVFASLHFSHSFTDQDSHGKFMLYWIKLTTSHEEV